MQKHKIHIFGIDIVPSVKGTDHLESKFEEMCFKG